MPPLSAMFSPCVLMPFNCDGEIKWFLWLVSSVFLRLFDDFHVFLWFFVIFQYFLNNFPTFFMISSQIPSKSTHFQLRCWFGVVAILFDDAFGSLQIAFLGVSRPPIDQITVEIKLTSLIVESMRNFMSDDKSNGTIVQVFWSFGWEEVALQYTSREF